MHDIIMNVIQGMFHPGMTHPKDELYKGRMLGDTVVVDIAPFNANVYTRVRLKFVSNCYNLLLQIKFWKGL